MKLEYHSVHFISEIFKKKESHKEIFLSTELEAYAIFLIVPDKDIKQVISFL